MAWSTRERRLDFGPPAQNMPPRALPHVEDLDSAHPRRGNRQVHPNGNTQQMTMPQMCKRTAPRDGQHIGVQWTCKEQDALTPTSALAKRARARRISWEGAFPSRVLSYQSQRSEYSSRTSCRVEQGRSKNIQMREECVNTTSKEIEHGRTRATTIN